MSSDIVQEGMEVRISNWMQTVLMRKKEFLIGAASVLAGIGILIGYFQSGPKAGAYADAETAFANWEASPDDESLYLKMKEAIQKAPAIERKYEAVIAQKLLDSARTEEGLVLAKGSVERSKGEIPYHADFAANSLLVEQGAFQEALEKTVQLKENMDRAFDLNRLAGERLVGGSLLYAHNLLRIACLQQQLNNKPGEKAAWEELESFIQGETPLADLVKASFSEKRIDLANYIADRKKQL